MEINQSKSLHQNSTKNANKSSSPPLLNIHSYNTLENSTLIPTTNLSVLNKEKQVNNINYSTIIDNIRFMSSSIDTTPQSFQSDDSFIDSITSEQNFTNVYNQSQNMKDKQEYEEIEDSYNDDNMNDYTSNEDLFDENYVDSEREQEIQCLTQLIRRDLPINDNVANIIMKQLNDILETTNDTTDYNEANQLKTSSSSLIATMTTTTTTTTTTPSQHPYPPIKQTGYVTPHDRPYADYGHLNRQTLTQEFQFNLQQSSSSNRQGCRLNARSFAITSWTNVPKESVMNYIKHDFDLANIQYICIAEEISELNHQRHLHIQIIFKEKINRRKPFLDEITQTHCNYQVTQNDCAWNEYIKKDGNYIEFGTFQSTTKHKPKQWPLSSSSSSSSSITSASSVPTSDTDNQLLLSTKGTKTTPTTTSIRAQTNEKRQYEENLVKQALNLAETSVDNAMDFIRHSMPIKIFNHSSWYLATFNYVYLRARRNIDHTQNIDKEYVWPLSFPDCTTKLQQSMNQWIQHHFSRAKRAKCLILIGPTGIGKTSFALSLPGHVNYFQERWNLDQWNDYARYSVYDDIPWDDFSKLNFPNKKGLLTQNGKMNATDKYSGTKQINVRQPAIVLLNPDDAGSLLDKPISYRQQQTADYWNKRAVIYIMDADEYFYIPHTHHQKQQHADTNTQSSSTSSTSSSQGQRIGESNEFQQMHQQYLQKHTK